MNKRKIEPFVRINSRIRKDQMKFVKDFARENGIGEGEAHRQLLDKLMEIK